MDFGKLIRDEARKAKDGFDRLCRVQQLSAEKARVEKMLKEKTILRDELDRAVFSLQRAVGNLETEIAVLDGQINLDFEEYANEY